MQIECSQVWRLDWSMGHAIARFSGTRQQDVFDYVELFYNPVRNQIRNGMLSRVEFERQQILKSEGI